jgi:hypothetical protein
MRLSTSAAAVLNRFGGDHEKARAYMRRLSKEYYDIAVEINQHETETNRRAYEYKQAAAGK